MLLKESNKAYLLIQNDERMFIVVDGAQYYIVQPPAWAKNTDDTDARITKKIELGKAVVYVDNGEEMVIFDADIDEVQDNLLGDGLELEAVEKMDLEMIDVAWFV